MTHGLTLPFVAMMDTSVFLCRLGENPENVDAVPCIDFCNRMMQQRRELWVSAPTITEVTRGRGKETPKVAGISVVAFDERAATLLGLKMPSSELKKWRDESQGRSLGHIKYDALVIGCALRIPNCTFVSLDVGQLALARKCGLPAHHPVDYFLSQSQLPAALQGGLFDPREGPDLA